MKLSDLRENDRQIAELLPALGAVGGAIGGAAKAVGGAMAKGASAVGSALKTTASGLAGGQMDPAQAAMAAKERQDQKKQIQDAIKNKQAELAELQKQLTQLG